MRKPLVLLVALAAFAACAKAAEPPPNASSTPASSSSASTLDASTDGDSVSMSGDVGLSMADASTGTGGAVVGPDDEGKVVAIGPGELVLFTAPGSVECKVVKGDKSLGQPKHEAPGELSWTVPTKPKIVGKHAVTVECGEKGKGKKKKRTSFTIEVLDHATVAPVQAPPPPPPSP